MFTHELSAFMSPKDIMDRMTLENAKNIMLMPLHPEKKIEQGLRIIEDASHILSYEITNLSRKSARSIHTKEIHTPINY